VTDITVTVDLPSTVQSGDVIVVYTDIPRFNWLPRWFMRWRFFRKSLADYRRIVSIAGNTMTVDKAITAPASARVGANR
jgi:hypothetical protein